MSRPRDWKGMGERVEQIGSFNVQCDVMCALDLSQISKAQRDQLNTKWPLNLHKIKFNEFFLLVC